MEVFRRAGLADFEDHSLKIMMQASSEYARTDVAFQEAFNQQKAQYKDEVAKLGIEKP